MVMKLKRHPYAIVWTLLHYICETQMCSCWICATVVEWHGCK